MANPDQRNGLLAHWAWCLPALLIVALLSLRQIDLYPPTPDEFFSMFNSGWLVNQPYSPFEIVQSLYTNSPTHTPAYFFILSAWGNITAFDVALGRTLGIFFGLLSLAVTYRLSREFVAPEAGLFAVVMLASNAFYNFFIPHVRMYGLFLFMTGVVLWLYLQIVYRLKNVGPRHYAAFGVSAYMYLNIHAFGVVFMLALGLYHVFMVPKNRNWWRVTVAGCTAALLLSPYAYILLSRGMERYVSNWGDASVGAGDALVAWLFVMTNGQPFLLLLLLSSLIYCAWRKYCRFWPPVMLIIFYLIAVATLATITELVTANGMRHLLPGIMPLSLAAAFGLMVLYSVHRWLALLVILWVIAGIWFQGAADWTALIAGRKLSFEFPPWQVVSRQAAQTDSKPVVIVHGISSHELEWESYINYSQRNYYFDDAGIRLDYTNDLHALELDLRYSAITLSDIWIVSGSEDAEVPEDVATILEELGYSLCSIEALGDRALIHKHSWPVLDCRHGEALSRASNDAVNYEFFAASLDASRNNLQFVDKWTRDDQGGNAHEETNMSFQLLSLDWDNVAQLDLPLVHEGVQRRFSIDVTDVDPGDYRLVAILYNHQTGERSVWHDNQGFSPDVLTLAEIVIPERP